MADTPPTSEVYYRFEDRREADWDPWAEFEQPNTSHCVVRICELPVLKHTPKGVWVKTNYGWRRGRFILHTSTKRYACATLEEAYQSFLARKERQASIHRTRMLHAEEAAQKAAKVFQDRQKKDAPK
jgi:hypothetical protein